MTISAYCALIPRYWACRELSLLTGTRQALGFTFGLLPMASKPSTGTEYFQSTGLIQKIFLMNGIINQRSAPKFLFQTGLSRAILSRRMWLMKRPAANLKN